MPKIIETPSSSPNLATPSQHPNLQPNQLPIRLLILLPKRHNPNFNTFPRFLPLTPRQPKRRMRAPPPRLPPLRIKPLKHHHLIWPHITQIPPLMHLPLLLSMTHHIILALNPRTTEFPLADLVVRVRDGGGVTDGEGVSADGF